VSADARGRSIVRAAVCGALPPPSRMAGIPSPRTPLTRTPFRACNFDRDCRTTSLRPSGADVAPFPLRRAWLVLAVVFVADVMDVIDSTIANLAGPSIRSDLGGSETTLQWVLTAYTAAFAIGLIASGRLGDLLGRRRLFLLGMAGFTLAAATA
jgi:hypothetical protein